MLCARRGEDPCWCCGHSPGVHLRCTRELGVDEPVSFPQEGIQQRTAEEIVVPVAHFQEQTVQVVKVTPPEGPAERMVEIVEEILKVVQTFLQERPLVFERIMKESSGVARSVPQECGSTHRRTSCECARTPDQGAHRACWQVIPQERRFERTVKQIGDFLPPLIVKNSCRWCTPSLRSAVTRASCPHLQVETEFRSEFCSEPWSKFVS